MDQSPVNPDKMIFASSYYTNYPTVKYSTDGGFTWNVRYNIGGEDRYISRVICDPIDENTFYIIRSGYSPGNKIYKTTDLGENWINISGDLPNIPHNDFFVDPETNNYYTANDFGVYSSSDGGSTWVREGSGMPFVVANDFDYVVYDSVAYLRIATFGRSVFETELGPISPTGIDDNKDQLLLYSLYQNYPNPFNPITRIKYSIPVKGNVTLSIINSIGERVEVLVDDFKEAGNYEAVWNAGGLPSGVYIYKVQVNDFTETKKMILLK